MLLFEKAMDCEIVSDAVQKSQNSRYRRLGLVGGSGDPGSRDRFPLARLVYSGVLQGTEGKELPKRQAQTVKRLWWLAVCGVLFPNLRKICPGGRVHGAVLDAVIQAGTIKRIS